MIFSVFINEMWFIQPVKFLRTPFLQNTSVRLLLLIDVKSVKKFKKTGLVQSIFVSFDKILNRH